MWLVKFDANWADEFDIYGFRLLTDGEKEHWDKTVVEKADEGFEWNFGTNEGFEDETVESFSHNYSFAKIEDEAVETIMSNFGKEFGHFPYLPDLIKESDEW